MHYWLSLTELLKRVQRISSLLEVWEFGRPGDCHQDRDTQTGCNDHLSGVRHKHERRSSPKTTGIFCDESWLTTGHWECDEIELYSPVIWTHCLIVSVSSSPSHCLQDQRELESESWLWRLLAAAGRMSRLQEVSWILHPWSTFHTYHTKSNTNAKYWLLHSVNMFYYAQNAECTRGIFQCFWFPAPFPGAGAERLNTWHATPGPRVSCLGHRVNQVSILSMNI